MQILFVSCSFPEQPDVQTHGVFNRLRTLVTGLAASGAEVTCLFYVRDQLLPIGPALALWQDRLASYFGVPITLRFAALRPRSPAVNSLGGLWRGACSFFWQDNYHRQAGPEQVQAFEDVLQSGFDLVFVHRLFSMPPVILARAVLPTVMLDLDDIEHVAFMREISQPPFWRSKYLRYLQVPALCWGERRAFHIASKTLVCSHLDVAKLRWLAKPSKVDVWPNAVSMPVVTPPAQAANLLFLGTFTYGPNVTAVEYFLRSIWPLVRQRMPAATFTVGGMQSENISFFKTPPPGVVFAGYIPDLNQAYASARAVVCTILSGGGTRVKVVEAAAFARAVVSTTVGAEGLDLVPGAEILIADTPQAFADHCVRLLSDWGYAQAIGIAARKKAESTYDRRSVVTQLAAWVQAVQPA